MNRTLPVFAILTAMTVLPSACSRPSSPKTAQHSKAVAPATKVVRPPAVTPAALSPGKTSVPPPTPDLPRAIDKFVAPFPDNVDFFKPPAVPPPPVKVETARNEPIESVVAPATPAIAQPKTPRPSLRLVGFVQVGEPKAILSTGTRLKVLRAGESLEDVEVVSVKPPLVTLRFDQEEFQINLLERKEPGLLAAGNPALAPSDPRLPPRPPRERRAEVPVPPPTAVPDPPKPDVILNTPTLPPPPPLPAAGQEKSLPVLPKSPAPPPASPATPKPT